MNDDWTIVPHGCCFRVFAPGGGETRGRFHHRGQAEAWIAQQRQAARNRNVAHGKIRLSSADFHGDNERAIPRR